MKNIGSIFKDAREKKRYSREKVSDITKIKVSFIEAIERGDWEVLPSQSTVIGFVRSIAKALNINETMAVATFKRDYIPTKIQVNPKQPQKKGVRWSPKVTLFAGVGVFFLLILIYLGFQYKRFTSPPNLQVDVPRENQLVTTSTLTVSGVTDGDATVKVNNQPALVGDDGVFSTKIDVTKEVKEVKVEAVSRSGKTSSVSRTIQVEHGRN